QAKIIPGRIILPRSNGEEINVPIDAATNFALADFDARKPGKAAAFTDERVWHMGIVLAAKELGLNLTNASVDLPRGEIRLRGAGGVERIIPVDSDGNFFVNWQLTATNSALVREPIEKLLLQDFQRLQGQTNGLQKNFAGKLVVVIYQLQG